MSALEKHAPLKKKMLRANHAPYMTKAFRKAIIKRSSLNNKVYKSWTKKTTRKHIKSKIITAADYIKKNVRNTTTT